jgi:hypothetical protein
MISMIAAHWGFSFRPPLIRGMAGLCCLLKKSSLDKKHWSIYVHTHPPLPNGRVGDIPDHCSLSPSERGGGVLRQIRLA